MNYPSPFYCGLPGQPVPEELDWDMWCGPTDPAPYHPQLYIPRGEPGWLSFRPYSGGEMTGWGAHGFDQIQTALGMDGTTPVEVWVEGNKFDPPTITEPEKSARANKICGEPKVHFRYASGVVIESVATKAPGFGGIFHCEKGTITIDRGVCKSDPPEIAREIVKSIKNSCLHTENWIACIKSREQPNADIEIGHRAATICHMGNIARWTNRKLRWDPLREVFPDDPAANKYLDYERRKPYGLPEEVA
jgi:hypothetical protein